MERFRRIYVCFKIVFFLSQIECRITLLTFCSISLDLVHITCRSRTDAPKSDIEPYESLLFSENESADVLWSMYFNIPSCMRCLNAVQTPSNCHIACSPYFELDYDETIRKAREIFMTIYENEEFLPRAPDPEQIIIEGDNPTAPLQSMIAELNLDLLSSDTETNNPVEPSATEPNVQNNSD